MSGPTLIDSDVLVWLTRGHVGAARRLHQLDPWSISVVTYIELAQGCRDKAELARLKKGLAARNTEVLQITPTISQRAAELVDALALSHGMRLADALIGATAMDYGLTLLSANAKHFGVVDGLMLESLCLERPKSAVSKNRCFRTAKRLAWGARDGSAVFTSCGNRTC